MNQIATSGAPKGKGGTAEAARPIQQQTRAKVKIADAPLNDEAAQERQVAALMAAWNKASAEARQEFLARIETPVMDAA